VDEASELAGEASADPADVVERIGREQHAVVTRAQLMAQGASADWIEHEVRMGRLLRVAPRTYRPWGTQRTWKLKASAAVHSAKAPALVSHQSAAFLWGITDQNVYPGFIDVTVPRHRRPKKRAGVQFHETRFFDLAQPAVLDRIAVTGVARTILDCCAVLTSYEQCLELLDEARRRRLVDWDELWECHLLHTGRGQPGFGRFRRLLFDRDGEVPPDSVFVRRVATLLEGAGIPAPLFDFPVLDGDYRIDMAWFPDTLRVGLECHGAIAHAHEAARENDAIRGNRIRLEGWMLLEVTWGRFRDDPAGIVADVKTALGLAL
jgi:hypothetical protein